MTESYEQRARRVLPEGVSAYYATVSEPGQFAGEGTAAWDAFRFRPRAFRNSGVPSLATILLDHPADSPILVAPMAQQIAAHPEAEVAMARAAAACGAVLGVSSNTAASFVDIAATGVAWWFQVYVLRDRGLTALLVRRAVDAGAQALILTVDMTVLLPDSVNPRNWTDQAAAARLSNLTAEERAVSGPYALDIDPTIGLDIIGWLRDLSGLPILVKGILRADDATWALNSGAAGVVVSTHGGRRMGTSISSARALREVVAAVGSRGEVYVDSGLRTGAHCAAALSLGARGTFIGRPLLWALAAAGEKGVADELTRFGAELELTMAQAGAMSIEELTPDLVAL